MRVAVHAMTINEDKVEIIAQQIAEYLVGRPDAADTLDGIGRWWLARIRLEEAASQVKQALDVLVARGVVVGTELPDGNVLYRSTPHREGLRGS